MPGWRAGSWRWRTEVTTTRIHDLAAEFGISSEQLMGMLKELDIFVRSHLTPLKDEQVSLMRARWEREKRRLKEPAAPTTKRRRALKVEVVPVVEEARPKRRRRTAAEVAVAEAEAPAETAPLPGGAGLQGPPGAAARAAQKRGKTGRDPGGG